MGLTKNVYILKSEEKESQWIHSGIYLNFSGLALEGVLTFGLGDQDVFELSEGSV